MNIKKLIDTPNQTSGRNGQIPIMIVDHITEGSFNGAVSWLRNGQSKASSHFVISKEGEIVQLVDIKNTAWCNGTSPNKGSKVWNGHSTNRIVKEKNVNANSFTVSIEHEGYTAHGGHMTTKQFNASVWLHKYIKDRVKQIWGYDIPIDREHIVGHYEVAPITKPTCGKNFNLDAIVEGVKDLEKSSKPSKPSNPVQGSWKDKLFKDSLKSLSDAGIIVSPDAWEGKAQDPIETWAVFELMARMLEK